MARSSASCFDVPSGSRRSRWSGTFIKRPSLLVGAAYWLEDSKNGGNIFAFAGIAAAGPTEPANLRAARQGVTLPAAFDAWFAKATAFSPKDRFPSASSAVQQLADALGQPRPGYSSATATMSPTASDVPPLGGTVPLPMAAPIPIAGVMTPPNAIATPSGVALTPPRAPMPSASPVVDGSVGTSNAASALATPRRRPFALVAGGITNPDQIDNDADGLGNSCDDDADNDGVQDADDNCAMAANTEQGDADGDGVGDVCDSDPDGGGNGASGSGGGSSTGSGAGGVAAAPDAESAGCACRAGAEGQTPAGILLALSSLGVLGARTRRRQGGETSGDVRRRGLRPQ